MLNANNFEYAYNSDRMSKGPWENEVHVASDLEKWFSDIKAV